MSELKALPGQTICQPRPLRRACPFCLGNMRLSFHNESVIREHVSHSPNEFCKMLDLHVASARKLEATVLAWEGGAR